MSLWDRLLDSSVRSLVRRGNLRLEMPDGTTAVYGDGTGDPVGVRLHDPALTRRLVLAPDMAVGEAYMDQNLTIDGDDLRGFFRVILSNRRERRFTGLARVGDAVQRVVQQILARNPIGRARDNVAHHYDLSSALYDLFLDADRQYSCAYFAQPDMSLEAAQEAKKHLIARKLRLEPGHKVLDIGCGWGGMGLTLARDYGARVVGVTLSEEQHKIATERARTEGLEDRVDFRLMDYRDVNETFDRIVSVGMFEHVGAAHYREYFGQVKKMLSDEGVALIHTIGSNGPPRPTSTWIRRYIFPGGYIPSLSQISEAIEDVGIDLSDLEVLRLHYAETLRHWSDRFEARIDEARELYDDRFTRMWRYYLIASEMTFRSDTQVVFQLQLSKDKTTLPMTREYLYRQ